MVEQQSQACGLSSDKAQACEDSGAIGAHENPGSKALNIVKDAVPGNAS